ncbi:PEP-CTERM sorting domain-containing protein [Eleftheria terrae]|uniref:PEP-CTERM sorting domain-containing protein n=1 Tax=Eleftheria terrae TaxID=1597781 RepID=UPI00263B95B7|nr:PEP-CTERM sorting domain-containing protein [Eleftheria terrae]WKB55861.1 PEP-CTERM sorting domain-containing protein [Eleftheria terrae]
MRRLHAALAALPSLAAAVPAWAVDTVWTGGAGPGRPDWDLAPNWSAGPPAASDTEALLGDHDTMLRRGRFVARGLRGTGTLRMTGGQLDLHAGASRLGALELTGGTLVGHGTALELGRLRWRGGSIGDRASVEGTDMALTVTGRTVLDGPSLVMAGAGSLQLNGRTEWRDGASVLATPQLVIGPEGVFHDTARTAAHALGAYGTTLRIEGRYVKTGAATTSVATRSYSFDNRGRLDVLGGTWEQRVEPGGSWSNSGHVRVKDATMRLNTFRAGVSQDGVVEVLSDAQLVVRYDRGLLASTGTWNIAKGGQVELVDSEFYNEFEARFDRGAVNNDGVLRFAEGRASIGSDVRLQGTGRLEVARAARVRVDGDIEMGALSVGDPLNNGDPPYASAQFSRLQVQGQMNLGELEWGEAVLQVAGPVTVRGRAELYDRRDYWAGFSLPPGKEIRSAYTFLGAAGWDGNADLYGSGSIRIGPDGRFEDRNSQGTRDSEFDVPRPTRVAVSSFLNEGRYLKTGAGATTVSAAFTNAGTVRSVAAGPLTFTGRFDNLGSVEVERGRLVLWGPLVQYRNGELSGGRLVARDGTLALNLGNGPDGRRPALIDTNRGELVLDGAQARIVTLWQGNEYNALGGALLNPGTVRLLGGADVQIHQLDNLGVMDIGTGSALRTTRYSQWAESAAAARPVTWLAGLVEAPVVELLGGDLSAGASGEVGRGSVQGELMLLGAGRLWLDVATGGDVDQLLVSGTARLEGLLWAQFDPASVVTGSYRFLTAEGGVRGQFLRVDSNLDSAHYQLALRYGADHVELVVSGVPEPGSWLLMGMGLAVLAGGLRRRAARNPGPGQAG